MSLIVPPRYEADRLKRKIVNKVLDIIYAQIIKGAGNESIRTELHRRKMPKMNDKELDALRAFFKEAEAKYPDKVATFRANAARA